MRRWNGWGEAAVDLDLPEGADAFLARVVGPATPPEDATLADAVAAVESGPMPALPAHPLVSTDPEDRLRHARGQSLPDWVALRSGRMGRVPDGVARPADGADVRDLLGWAASAGARVVPYGGGTSVLGHLDAPDGDAPWLSVDVARMAGLARWDPASGLATFGPGTAGPAVESALAAVGRTLGHFPQSFELSTVGGWVATRSVGQQSIGYGRIDERFAGGVLEAPAGRLVLPPHPASAAGPDIRQLVLGSEGRLGIVTEATLRTSPLPEDERFGAVFFPDWDRAMEGIRALAQAELPLSMIRLSTPAETETNLALAGHARTMAALRLFLRARGAGPGRAMAIVGVAGGRATASVAARDAFGILGRHGGVRAPRVGAEWRKNRFRTAYLRNALWDAGYAVDTLETAADWSVVPALLAGLAPAVRRRLEPLGERVHAFAHLSHVYPSGSSVYVTYVFRLSPDPDETLARWRSIKEAASATITELGGTISHQHGVGRDHRAWLPAEKGTLWIAAIRAVAAAFDPDGIMAPGVLVAGPDGTGSRAVPAVSKTKRKAASRRATKKAADA
jgi:alkyldihydroxyacetonephosphate synthase